MPATDAHGAQGAYDALAPLYDDYTTDYDHERWLAAIVELALRHGLRGPRALDVACGTGASALPLARLGYRVDACDISPGMLERARPKLEPFGGRVFEADMRSLPTLGAYDLITCLDDAIDYLVEGEDLARAMRSFASVLSPDGVLVFDVNTLRTYRTVFTTDFVEERADHLFCGRGEASRRGAPGSVFHMRIDAFTPASDGLWRRTISRHRQRHQPRERLEAATRDAGLKIVAAYGQRTGVQISDEPDERRDAKVLYVVRPLGADA